MKKQYDMPFRWISQEELGMLLSGTAQQSQRKVPLPGTMYANNALGADHIRKIIPVLHENGIDIFALSDYVSSLVSCGEFRAVHHFIMLLYSMCSMPIPLSMIEAIRSDAELRAHVAGVLHGLATEEREMNELYTMSNMGALNRINLPNDF